MSKHTPGPWVAVRDPGHYHSLSTVVAGDQAKINSRYRMQVEVGGWASPSEQEANTRLIAAAPDLLAALQGLLAIVADSRGVAGYHLNGEIAEWDEFDEVEAARAAIAKAAGSTP